jgi:hypothetical protein
VEAQAGLDGGPDSEQEEQRWVESRSGLLANRSSKRFWGDVHDGLGVESPIGSDLEALRAILGVWIRGYRQMPPTG